MRTFIAVMILAGVALNGCDINFPNQEMDLAGSGRTRPFAVVCDPAEAAPGETVTARLYFYEPSPEALAIDWTVALDYDMGLYETDEVERNFVEPDIVWDPEFDAYGFGTQSIVFTIPEDVLLTTSSHPDVIEDELILTLARPLLGLEADKPVPRAAIVELLATADPLANPDIDTQAFLWLSDIFACRIRFRASMHSDVVVDVVKNLTVRYSRRNMSLNVNENTRLHISSILAIPHPDVAYDDVYDFLEESINFNFDDPGDIRIPAHADWTYYLTRSLGLQTYTSPFAAGEEGVGSVGGFQERYNLNWYGFDMTNPGSGHPLFLAEDGDEAEMNDLTDAARIQPPLDGAERTFRVVGVLRDVRMEWQMYGFAPGASVDEAVFTFVPPDPFE